MPAAFDGDPSTVGEYVTRTYLSLWEEAETGPVMMGVVRSAVSHEASAWRLREFAGSLLLAPAAERLHVDAPELRVALALSWSGWRWPATSCGSTPLPTPT